MNRAIIAEIIIRIGRAYIGLIENTPTASA